MKKRIEYIVSNEGMSYLKFAQEIGVSAGSITHIISGRNNPSLDIVVKIAHRFPHYNLRWLVLGELPILTIETSSCDNSVSIESNPQSETPPAHTIDYSELSHTTQLNDKTFENINAISNNIVTPPTERLIICFPDNTFSEYTKR